MELEMLPTGFDDDDYLMFTVISGEFYCETQ